MNLYTAFFRPLMFLFPTETAHNIAVKLAEAASQSSFLLAVVNNSFAFNTTSHFLEQTLFGLDFPNPIGLAAGFDKNGVALPFWDALGFGFLTMGTVTAQCQSGNPRPRMFRSPKDAALLNRMGFNNRGAANVAAHLKKSFGQKKQPKVPVGISIGKSKVIDPSHLAEVIADHIISMTLLYDYADFFELNVTSPNTPGLRTLLAPDKLRPLLENLLRHLKLMWTESLPCRSHAAHNTKRDRKPLLVKLSPDMSDDEVREVIDLVLELGVDGVVNGNTTIDPSTIPSLAHEQGGRSGKHLFPRTLKRTSFIRELAPGLPLIAVGGIFTPKDAVEVIREGADLVQGYTGFVFQGPSYVGDIAEGIHQTMVERHAISIKNLQRH